MWGIYKDTHLIKNYGDDYYQAYQDLILLFTTYGWEYELKKVDEK